MMYNYHISKLFDMDTSLLKEKMQMDRGNADNKKLGNLKVIFSLATLSTVSSICGIVGFFLQLYTLPSSLKGGNWMAVIFGILVLIVSIAIIVYVAELKKTGEKGKCYIRGESVYINIESNAISRQRGSTARWTDRRKIRNIFIAFAVFTYFIFNVGALYLDVINNSDYLKKAESGDVYSQVYIADYYREIEDEDNCLYWYAVASVSDNKYGNIACNNLAYLYWQKHKTDGDLEIYLSRIYELLKKSALGGNKTGEENLFRFVYYYDFVYELNEDDRRKVMDLLIRGGFIKDFSSYREAVWEDAGTLTVKDKIMFSDEYTKYELKDISRASDKEDNTKIITTRVYMVKESSLKPDKMILIYDSDINK